MKSGILNAGYHADSKSTAQKGACKVPFFYPPSQNTTGLPLDERQKNELMLRCDVTPRIRRIITASCLGEARRAKTEAEGEDGPVTAKLAERRRIF